MEELLYVQEVIKGKKDVVSGHIAILLLSIILELDITLQLHKIPTIIADQDGHVLALFIQELDALQECILMEMTLRALIYPLCIMLLIGII